MDPSGNPIRVHFGPMPEMLRSIMCDLLAAEPDIIVTGSSAGREDCLRAARAQQAEIILVQDDVHQAASCLDLILAKPVFGLFAVSADGASALRVSLARRPMSLDDKGGSGLADAIRATATELRAAAEPSSRGTHQPINQPKADARKAPG